MKQRVLVAFATKSGSTAEMAHAIGKELAAGGAQVDVRPAKDVQDVTGYDAVVVGGPMIFSWHGDARQFVQRNQEALSKVPVAYFVAALSLTRHNDSQLDGLPIYQDLSLAKPAKDAAKPSFKERYATVANYIGPILRGAPGVRPVSVGFLHGKLDMARLDLFSRLFVRFVIGAHAGDYRNWQAVTGWAAALRVDLRREEGQACQMATVPLRA